MEETLLSKEDNVVYERVGSFQEDEEGLGRLIPTDLNEIHEPKGSALDPHWLGQEPSDIRLPDSTINDLVDQFDTGVEEGEFPQARGDNEYTATTTKQSQLRDYPQRIRKPSQRVLDNIIHYDEIPVDGPEVYVNNVFAPLEDEPATYKEAIQSPDSKKWYTAMGKQVDSLLNAGTWKSIKKATVPPSHRILTGKWVNKRKRDGTYKARWVVKGFEQVKGLDYQQIFAAVVRADTFRTLLAIATLLDWDISNVDIDSAFLYGDIDKESYIELPEGFFASDSCGKLLKSIYGLKQAHVSGPKRSMES